MGFVKTRKQIYLRYHSKTQG